jgi:transaldolase
MFSEYSFSLWCDFIERDFLEKEFKELLSKDIINGATSNPAIFQNAFKSSSAYVNQIQELKSKGLDSMAIYEQLAKSDIIKACDILKPIYDKNNNNGFVSLEVNPLICDDVEKTCKEAIRLNNEINKENLMIKVPATKAGIEAMSILAKEGLNINATLIFSQEQTKQTLQALSHLHKDKKGVISIFVSRFDRKLDPHLAPGDRSKVGIYNASKCYNIIENSNIKNVRALFASTGVKGDSLEKDYYIKELLYKNAINTAPVDTINAFMKNGGFAIKETMYNEQIDNFFDKIGIDLNQICDELLQEGLIAFKHSFDDILEMF